MKRAVILGLLLWVAAGVAFAQIMGEVKTADGSPAAYATVLLYPDSNTMATPLGYSLTTSDGHFSLVADATDGSYIVVRHLGSKEFRRRLGKSRKLSIRLETDVQNLDEVMVRSTYVPVQVHGDTIGFNTDYFRTGTEETAAEVLKQIPGMEVSESGEVSYAGKAVDKVLVDGKDLFASGSDGALNTLPAEAIRGAELLMNYRSGSLIDQFSGREMTALNLKTDGRHRVAGRISAAGGLLAKGKADASMLYMGNSLSLTSVLAANNTGDALFSIEDYIKTVVGLDNIISTGGRGFNPSEEELRMLMPPSNVYASRGVLGSLSGTWNPSNAFKMKGNLMLNGSALDASSLSNYHYLAFDAMQQHQTEQLSCSLFTTGHLQATWKPTESLEVSNLVQLAHTGLLTSEHLEESGLTDLLAYQDDSLGKYQSKEELALNFKPNEKSLLAAHVVLHHTRRNYSNALLTTNALLPTVQYDTLDDGRYELDLNRDISDLQFRPDFSFAYNLTRKLTLTLSTEYEYDKSRFQYGVDAVDDHIEWNSVGGSLKLSKPRGLFRFDIGAQIKHTAWVSSIAQLADSAQTYILPTASIELAFNETHRLSLSGELSRDPIELEYLQRDTLVGGYNSLLAGSEITNPFAQSANLQLNYHFFDLFTNTMFFAVAGMTESRFSVRPHSTQDETIATISRYNNDGQMQVGFVNASLRQGLGHLPWDISLSGNITRTATTTAVNSLDTAMNTIAYGGRIGLSSRRKSVLNFDFGISLNTSSSDYNGTTSELVEAGAHAALLFAWGDLSGQARLAYAHVDGNGQPRDFYDVSLRAEYKIKRWSILLRGGNLLHLNDQQWITTATTPLYLATTTYRRLPGYLLLGANYRF